MYILLSVRNDKTLATNDDSGRGSLNRDLKCCDFHLQTVKKTKMRTDFRHFHVTERTTTRDEPLVFDFRAFLNSQNIFGIHIKIKLTRQVYSINSRTLRILREPLLRKYSCPSLPFLRILQGKTKKN